MKIAVFYENIYEGAQATGRRVETALEECAQAGMEMLYLSAASWRRDEKWLKPVMQQLHLGLEGMHAFCDFAREPDSDEYRRLIDLACEAGAGNLLFVPGMLQSANSLTDYERIFGGMQKAVDYGSKRGMPILMEDFDGLFAPYNSILSLSRFLNGIEGLGCAFDTGNFVMYREDEMEALALFMDRIVTVHLKDRALTPSHFGDQPLKCARGESVYTCPVGSGLIRMTAIIQRLAAAGYKGNLIAELYGCDTRHVQEGILQSIDFLKRTLARL